MKKMNQKKGKMVLIVIITGFLLVPSGIYGVKALRERNEKFHEITWVKKEEGKPDSLFKGKVKDPDSVPDTLEFKKGVTDTIRPLADSGVKPKIILIKR